MKISFDGHEVAQSLALDTFLPYRIRRLAAAVSSPKTVTLGDGSVIRAREWRVILVLAAFGPMAIKTVAQKSIMDAATTTRAVQNLISMGMVESRTHKGDRRQQVVRLTQKGAEAHDEIAPDRRRFSDDVLAVLSSEDQASLFRLIDRLEARLSELSSTNLNAYFDE